MTVQHHHSVESARRGAVPFPADVALRAQVRELTALVGELTLALVIQGAYLAALKHHRATPDARDVDEAIARVADNVPAAVADELWAGRDALLARLRDEPSRS